MTCISYIIVEESFNTIYVREEINQDFVRTVLRTVLRTVFRTVLKNNIYHLVNEKWIQYID